MNEILTWGGGTKGTLKQYIIECYKCYADLGLYSWGSIINYKGKINVEK